MSNRERIDAAIQEYCRAMTAKDKTAWLALFSLSIRHQDPVGSPVNEGIEQVAAFWDSVQPYDIDLRLKGTPIVRSNEAIAPMRAELGPSNARRVMGDVYDHFIFDERVKIISLRAFYDDVL